MNAKKLKKSLNISNNLKKDQENQQQQKYFKKIK